MNEYFLNDCFPNYYKDYLKLLIIHLSDYMKKDNQSHSL